MNRYPVWKYATLLVALLIGALYTLPNFFGEAPAVQVSAAKTTVKVDTGVLARVEDALQRDGLAADAISLEGGSIKARFNSTDIQLKAKDAIQKALVPNPEEPSFVVALNLLPRSPAWLAALNAAPHVLGAGLARRRALYVAGGHGGGAD